MRVVTVDPVHPDPSVLAEAARLIRGGELVAFPTETVYGLGANAFDADAVVRIYAAKGRPAWNPVIVHVASAAEARALAAAWPASAARLAERCWPGPLTLVVPRGTAIPDVVAAGGDTVALRVPAHPVALALIEAAACPIAAPSANRFTQVSPTTARHVVQSLGDRVPLVLDGGACAVGIESTVVHCTDDAVIILRPGMIGRETLEAALDGLGIVVRHVTPASIPHDTPATDAPSAAAPRGAVASPGMADRHYAPRADVWLFTTAQHDEVNAALHARTGSPETGRPMIALMRTGVFGNSSVETIMMPREPAPYAQALYAALHEVDTRGATLVLIEAPPDEPAWHGIRDRLTRASR